MYKNNYNNCYNVEDYEESNEYNNEKSVPMDKSNKGFSLSFCLNFSFC